jgi:DNA-binding NarL/FixJ family response regulator
VAFDLALVDLCMTPLNGVETVRALQALVPDALYLFMTGYTSRAEVHEARALSGREVIFKPFTMSELTRILEAELSTRATGASSVRARPTLEETAKLGSVQEKR